MPLTLALSPSDWGEGDLILVRLTQGGVRASPRSHLINTCSGVARKSMTTFQLKMGGWQTNGTADLWAGRVVVRRFGFPSPANRVPRKDVRFAHSSQPAEGMRAASRLAAGPNLWPRHLLLFMR